MKQYLSLIVLFFISCNKPIAPNIIGNWQVKSKYYKANYKIEQHQDKLIAKVLYYNDDTTVLTATNTNADIFLHNLKYKDTVFIDAIAGATQTKNTTQIKVTHKDTLRVTSYIQNKPLTETWTRKH